MFKKYTKMQFNMAGNGNTYINIRIIYKNYYIINSSFIKINQYLIYSNYSRLIAADFSDDLMLLIDFIAKNSCCVL